MTDQFNMEVYKNLSSITNKHCISIYLPTHQSGIEVNEGMDRIAFKNQLYEVKENLIRNGEPENYIDRLLRPAFELYDKIDFWHNLAQGIACFITEGVFKIYRLKCSFKPFTNTGQSFFLLP